MHGLNIYDVQIHIEFDLTPQAAAIAKERIEASAADIHWSICDNKFKFNKDKT